MAIGSDDASVVGHASSTNGNGTHAEPIVVQVTSSVEESAAHSSGNGATNSSIAAPVPPPVIPSIISATVQAHTDTSTASTSAPAATASESVRSLDMAVDVKAAGQIETVAVTTAVAAASSSTASSSIAPTETKKPLTAAGTPYKNPGGRWSSIKGYSVFQVGTAEFFSILDAAIIVQRCLHACVQAHWVCACKHCSANNAFRFVHAAQHL